MKIFVYEYICATSRPEANEPRVASLMAEGRAMLDAAVEDCTAIPGAEVVVADDESNFRKLASGCDYAMIIAPEFDRILETRAIWAIQCGAGLLGPPPEAIALCADKLALARLWKHMNVPTPPTSDFDPHKFSPPVVVKPRDGAGSIETHVIENQKTLSEFRPARASVIQPFIDTGQSYSISFLIGPKQCIALTPCWQDIRIVEGAIEYHGGRTLSASKLTERIESLGRKAIAAVPSLAGYVGVDVHLDPDCVIEINPRLTTSYVGLRRLTQSNLMKALIAVVNGEKCDVPAWSVDEVEFNCAGTITYASSKRR